MENKDLRKAIEEWGKASPILEERMKEITEATHGCSVDYIEFIEVGPNGVVDFNATAYSNCSCCSADSMYMSCTIEDLLDVEGAIVRIKDKKLKDQLEKVKQDEARAAILKADRLEKEKLEYERLKDKFG